MIIGECRGPEALDMLQAMNTGHDGSMTTIHANDPRDAVGPHGDDDGDGRLRPADLDHPPPDLLGRPDHRPGHAALTGGVRKVTRIAEITGMEGEVITMHDLFAFKQTGLDKNRMAEGYFYGQRASARSCMERL